MDDFNDIIHTICKNLELERQNIEVVFGENLEHEVDKYCQLFNYEKIDHFNDISFYNGTAYCFGNINDKWYIFINTTTEKYNEGRLTSTIMHEMLHIDDFIKFGKYIEIFDFNQLMKHEDYKGFYLWTEYRAQKFCYLDYLDEYHGLMLDNTNWNNQIAEEYMIRTKEMLSNIEYDYRISKWRNLINSISNVYQYDVINILRNSKYEQIEEIFKKNQDKLVCNFGILFQILSSCWSFEQYQKCIPLVNKLIN